MKVSIFCDFWKMGGLGLKCMGNERPGKNAIHNVGIGWKLDVDMEHHVKESVLRCIFQITIYCVISKRSTPKALQNGVTFPSPL